MESDQGLDTRFARIEPVQKLRRSRALGLGGAPAGAGSRGLHRRPLLIPPDLRSRSRAHHAEKVVAAPHLGSPEPPGSKKLQANV